MNGWVNEFPGHAFKNDIIETEYGINLSVKLRQIHKRIQY